MLLLVACCFCFKRQPSVSFHSFSCVGMDNLNKWIDDRLSFERVRHRKKEKYDNKYCPMDDAILVSFSDFRGLGEENGCFLAFTALGVVCFRGVGLKNWYFGFGMQFSTISNCK